MNELATKSAEALQKLVEAVQQASPAVWAAAQAKVQANIMVEQFWVSASIWAASILLTIFIGGILLEIWFDYNGQLAGPLCSISLIGMLISAIVGVSSYVDVIAYRAAPDWHAIQLIMSQVR